MLCEETIMVRRAAAIVAAVLITLAAQAAPQNGPSGPATSTAEARAVGYMRTVFGAQREYKKKHAAYAKSLASLVGNGSFTRRMATNDRGDYTVHFSGTGQGFSLGMVPKTFDAEHRAFFINETGTLRVETDKPASPQSPPLK
jgi:hypothetical protein